MPVTYTSIVDGHTGLAAPTRGSTDAGRVHHQGMWPGGGRAPQPRLPRHPSPLAGPA